MTIIYLAVLWCLGIWAATSLGNNVALWTACAIVSVILAIAVRTARSEQSRLLMMAFCLLAFCVGGLRASTTISSINVKQFHNYGNDPEVTLIGTIIDQPRVRDTSVLLTVAVARVYGDGETERASRGRILLHAPRFSAFKYGDHLRVTGTPQRVENWGEFDYREYLARQGIFHEMRGAHITLLAEGTGSPFYQALFRVRDRAQGIINRLIPDAESSLLSGILLGDDSGMPARLRDDFRTTGMSHIIAISGFNIAILAGVLLRAGRWLPGLRTSGFVAITGVIIYALFVGADAAVVRAAIMAALYIFSHRVLGRPTFAPASLFVAAMLMTLIDPYALWDIGFQLSFAATLGLMLFVAPTSAAVRDKLAQHLPGAFVGRVMPLLTDVVIVTMAAQLMTLPLLAYHFGEISLASLVANLLILPAQPGVMLWGGLATLAGMVSIELAQPIAWVAWLFLGYTTYLVELLAQLPHALVSIEPGVVSVVLYYLAAIGAYWLTVQSKEQREALLVQIRGRAAHGAPVILGLSLGLIVIWSRTQPDGNLRVAFLDVGQGDAIFVQTPEGRQLLVDGGQYPSLIKRHLGRQMPFWDRHVDIVVATHPDDDHVAGLPELFERYNVELLVTNGAEAGASQAYGQLLEEAQKRGVPVHVPEVGEQLRLGEEVALTFLHPGQASLTSDNDSSVAIRLTYGNFSVLLTGDAELEGERMMAASGLPLQALVFKAGHHGSRSSSNAFFLELVQPQIVVVSAGSGNRFDHPHLEVLERAEALGAVILRTDELGTIEIVSDGQQMWWETER
jgi:competence protein ComEC